MRRALLTTAATLAMTAAAEAQGSHANPDYPAPEALEEAEPGRNLGGFGRLFPVRAPDTPDGLLPHPSPRYDLVRLGQRMTVPNEEAQPPGEMPVGYVFLGQFIDHDVTFDTVTSFDELAATQGLENARTADLDLDCVYGGGPERDPWLYDGPYLRTGATVVRGGAATTRFDVLRTPPPGRPVALIGDPRNDENFAIAQVQAAFVAFHNRMVDRILQRHADEAQEIVLRAEGEGFGRNARESAPPARPGPATAAGNLAQLLAARMMGPRPESREPVVNVTRAFVLEIAEENGRVHEILEEARAAAIHHYHRVIVEDFVPRIIGIARTRDMLENGRDFYFPNGFRTGDGRVTEPFIPISFAVAAYRFGHSQVPGIMRLRGSRTDAVLAELFGADKSVQGANFLTPDGFTPVRTEAGSLVLDWNLFVPIHGPAGLVQRARRLDTVLADPLAILDEVGVVGPGGLGNLASRNLTRGRTYMLPAGQTLARVILRRLEERGVLTDVYPGGGTAEDYVLPADAVTRETLALGVTPLWYYVLQEADAFGATWQAGIGGQESALGGSDAARLTGLPEAVGLPSGGARETTGRARGASGATLGPVGGTLVGEVLLGLVDHHREAEGEGLDLNPDWMYEILRPEAGPVALGDLPAMTETAFEAGGASFGRRYLFRNFLHDAGVSGVPAADAVCRGAATLAAEGC